MCKKKELVFETVYLKYPNESSVSQANLISQEDDLELWILLPSPCKS